jgi:hypothetical protein
MSIDVIVLLIAGRAQGSETLHEAVLQSGHHNRF